MKQTLKKIPDKWASWRDQLRDRSALDLGYRIAVGVVGGLVLIVGIIAIPYPGPGWAIVFLGLGILATEFEFARRALVYVRHRYDTVMAWFGKQGLWVKVLGVVFTCAVVLATTWLLGAVGWMAGLVGIDWPWLQSPIGLGS
ncbi:MAG: TIGR02611 family protein [Mycobacterium sp.]